MIRSKIELKNGTIWEMSYSLNASPRINPSDSYAWYYGFSRTKERRIVHDLSSIEMFSFFSNHRSSQTLLLKILLCFIKGTVIIMNRTWLSVKISRSSATFSALVIGTILWANFRARINTSTIWDYMTPISIKTIII